MEDTSLEENAVLEEVDEEEALETLDFYFEQHTLECESSSSCTFQRISQNYHVEDRSQTLPISQFLQSVGIMSQGTSPAERSRKLSELFTIFDFVQSKGLSLSDGDDLLRMIGSLCDSNGVLLSLPRCFKTVQRFMSKAKTALQLNPTTVFCDLPSVFFGKEGAGKRKPYHGVRQSVIASVSALLDCFVLANAIHNLNHTYANTGRRPSDRRTSSGERLI